MKPHYVIANPSEWMRQLPTGADCPLCHGSGEVINRKTRLMGYTLTNGESIDEELKPCPLCTNNLRRKTLETLKEIQELNCRGCKFADPKKVGTGKACCTYPRVPRMEGNKCLTRKEA